VAHGCTKSNSRGCQDRRGGADAEGENQARRDIDEEGHDEEGRLFVPTRSFPTRRCPDEEVSPDKEAPDEKACNKGVTLVEHDREGNLECHCCFIGIGLFI
jgi:hypothetical protein